MYEYTAKHVEDLPRSSDRTFGFIFSGIFLAIAAYPLIHGQPVRIWAIGLAVPLAVVSIVCPWLLRSAHDLWIKFGLNLHALMSPVALALLFFLAVVPTGLIMRALGKRFLQLRIDPAAETYWIERRPTGPTPESLHQQF